MSTKIEHVPGSELYRTWCVNEFQHYSAQDLNAFHFVDGFDVTLPVNGDRSRLTL